MHPYRHAQATPDKPAIIVAETGQATSYAELDARSNQAAQLFRAEGLNPGDKVVTSSYESYEDMGELVINDSKE